MKKIHYLLVLVIWITGCDEIATGFMRGMLEGRISANEETAQVFCGIYARAISAFRDTEGRYPFNFQELSEINYISSKSPHHRLVLRSKPAQGYVYSYHYIDADHFILEAKPAKMGITGHRVFRVDEKGKVYAVEQAQY